MSNIHVPIAARAASTGVKWGDVTATELYTLSTAKGEKLGLKLTLYSGRYIRVELPVTDALELTNYIVDAIESE